MIPGHEGGLHLALKCSGEFLTAKRKATEALEREASVMDCRPLDKGFLTTSTASASSLSHTKPVARRDAAQHQKRCEAEIGEETQFQGYEAFTPELDKTQSSACLLQAAGAKAIRYSSAFLIIILGYLLIFWYWQGKLAKACPPLLLEPLGKDSTLQGSLLLGSTNGLRRRLSLKAKEGV